MKKSSTDTFSDRLKLVRKSYGLSQKGLSAKIGASQSYLSELENGKATPTDALVTTIAHHLSINREWLLSGIGEMRATPPWPPERISPTILLHGDLTEKPDVALDDYYAAPLLEGRIAAGFGGIINERDVRSLVWIYAPALRDRYRHRLIAVEVAQDNGMSMIPTIFPEDIVLVDCDDPGGDLNTFRSGRIYAIRTGNQEQCAVKRIYSTNGQLVISSDNREYPPAIAWTDDIQKLIIGRVVWGWRNLLNL